MTKLKLWQKGRDEREDAFHAAGRLGHCGASVNLSLTHRRSALGSQISVHIGESMGTSGRQKRIDAEHRTMLFDLEQHKARVLAMPDILDARPDKTPHVRMRPA